MLQFPKLRQDLYKSPLTQVLKAVEELGELAQKLVVLMDIAGNRKERPDNIVELTAEEGIDAAQACCGVLYALEWVHGVDINKAMEQHIKKMMDKGYMDD